MNSQLSNDVLLVEDCDFDAEMTIHALRTQHLANRIIRTRDGVEALDYLYCREVYSDREPSNPRLVLLDLKMPRVDGLEVLSAMKNDPALKTIPVVMLTSSAEESDLVKSYGLGANSYVVKPVDFDHFAAEVSKLGFYWLLINRSIEN